MAAPADDTLFIGASELAGLMRGLDWRRTPVGPPSEWPRSVRAVVRLMLTSRYAMWMGWGGELTFFYNDAYAAMTLGAKHPWALGQPANRVWAEIWGDIGPRIDRVLATGEATWDEGLLLFLERSGFPEETYHTFSYSPLHDDAGLVRGMFCVVTEETSRVIGERRLAVLREFAARLAAAQTTEDVWQAVTHSLSSDARDLPFTLIYRLGDGDQPATLVASSNVPADAAIAPAELGFDDDRWPLRRAVEDASQTPVLVAAPPGAVWPSGPWQRPPARALVLPIAQPGQPRPAGVFIAALNPFRAFDAEYESFVKLFVGQLSAGLANAEAYAAERRRAEALAQIDRAKTTFFSNVSHELRTPLTLMLGPMSDALSSGRPLGGETLALAFRNAERLQKLVNGLLDFTRIEAGRIDARFEPIDLAAYTAELASAFESAVERAGLRYTVRAERGGEPAYVDRDMWEKIVLNLISNAFKFTLEGEIAVTMRQADGAMVLEVRDTGSGIPAAELPRVFERFHRVEGVTGRTHEGTGIGLALVHELVKLHGGRIEVESELGSGTTFTVTIPLGVAHLPPDRLLARGPDEVAPNRQVFVAQAEHWLASGSETLDDSLIAAALPSTELPARILIADDNRDMRTYLTSLLGERWQIEVASDGADALQRMRTAPPDLLITDVMMPRLDGFALLRELRADPATRHVRVMMLSARAGEEARIEGFQAGADDYLVKPFTARELVARVEAQLLRGQVRAAEERQRNRVATVFTNAPVAVAIMRGPDHVFEFANPRYLEIVGRTEVVGRAAHEVFPELRGQGVFELLDEVARSGEPYVGRARRMYLRRTGSHEPEECFFDFVSQPIWDGDGRMDGIAVVAIDVSEQVRARRAAEDANRAKDEFLAMLGHELRNPLAPILTALQLLRLRGIDAGERERTIIERQVRHLVSLVDDLLDVSRITRGKVRLAPQSTELTEVVAKAIELASPLLEQHHHDLQIDVPRTGLTVMADPARLAQVVANLLTNAAKYTPAGGMIRITARRDGGEVVLSVRDTGIGIDPDMLSRIFDLFTQDRQALDRAQGGLGLGLAIVKSLVELHGGSVAVHSEGRDRGSEFLVRLPLVTLAVSAPPADELSPVRAPATGLRVLVVDDNEDAAEMLAMTLSVSGHETAVALDGPTALEQAARFRPDVALLDIGLPVMDGFELAQKLRALPGLAQMPLVAVTGYGQEHDRRRSAASGFDAHLVKPIDFDHLSALLHDLAHGRGRDPRQAPEPAGTDSRLDRQQRT